MAGQKSNLVPIGVLFIILSFFSNQVDKLAASATVGTFKGLLLLATDGVRLCFFIGAALLIIGIIRNNRKRKQ